MVKLTIRTMNAAFQDGHGGAEVARILRKIADEIESGVRGSHALLDCNGNRVGNYQARIEG